MIVVILGEGGKVVMIVIVLDVREIRAPDVWELQPSRTAIWEGTYRRECTRLR